MDIIDYGVNTPQNFNPNVVRGMINNSGGNTGGSTEADWEAAYGEEGYIKNKPFYEEVGELTTIIPEFSFTFTFNDEEWWYEAYDINAPVSSNFVAPEYFTEGYTIIFDGQEYEGYYDSGYFADQSSNFLIHLEYNYDSGEVGDSVSYIQSYDAENPNLAGTHTLSVVQLPVTIHQLDTKFLNMDEIAYAHNHTVDWRYDIVNQPPFNASQYNNIGISAYQGTASGQQSFAIGGAASGSNACSLGGTASGEHAIALGGTASGQYACSLRGVASGEHAIALGGTASGQYAVSENSGEAIGQNSHAEGTNISKGMNSHSEGQTTNSITLVKSQLQYNSTKGLYHITSDQAPIPRLGNVFKIGDEYAYITSITYNHTPPLIAEHVDFNLAPITPTQYNALSENIHINYIYGIALGSNSHSEGKGCNAIGDNSHAQGQNTASKGTYSHSEGLCTVACGDGSHTEGAWTVANGPCQHVFGKYNVIEEATSASQFQYVEIVGNGTDDRSSYRSNARTLDWNGNETLAGGLTVNSTSGITIGQTTITETQLTTLLTTNRLLLIATQTDNGWVLDKTAGEIAAAFLAGIPVFVKFRYPTWNYYTIEPMDAYFYDEGFSIKYKFASGGAGGYDAVSDNDYPVYDPEN